MRPEKKWVKSWSRGKKKTQAPLKNKATWVLHNHSHSILARGFEVSKKPFPFTNTEEGFESFVSWIYNLAEAAAMNHEPLTMKDHVNRLDRILSANGENLLEGSGSISHEDAMEKARAEYRKYQVKTISPVEAEYLKSITEMARAAKREGKQ